MLVLLNLDSKVNAIYLTFGKELGLLIKPIDIRKQNIHDTMLDTFGIVVAAFSVMDKANQVRFFEETFLVANVSPKVVFGILFLTLSGVDNNFLGWELRWRTYTTNEVFPTTKCVELVGKKEFAAAAFDLEYETFMVYVASVSSTPIVASLGFTSLDADVYLSHRL